jgi:hypothetical protein
VNLSIHTIYLDSHLSRHKLFRGSVILYLETNRLRPRLLAIQKTRPIAYRTKVLGKALLAVRTNANRFWMLLSGNADVAFPSGTTTIAATANFPTTATVTSMMAALTIIAAGSLPTAVPPAATSTTTPSTASASDPTAAVAVAVADQTRNTCP